MYVVMAFGCLFSASSVALAFTLAYRNARCAPARPSDLQECDKPAGHKQASARLKG